MVDTFHAICLGGTEVMSERLNRARGLQEQFAAVPGLRFREDASGIVFVDIEGRAATGSLTLQGAQILLWQPRHSAAPVLWLSDHAKAVPGKSLRGGAPVCWPWFGAHATDATVAAHGFARNRDWQLREARVAIDGTHELVLVLAGDQRTQGAGETPAQRQLRDAWPHAFELELRIAFGALLRATLTSRNRGGASMPVGEALHTYFRVGDIGQIRLLGLESCDYEDKVGPPARRRQQGPVQFEGETDRVYLDRRAECVIDDPVLARRIHVRKSGSGSTVVWSPGVEKAARLGDLGEGSRPGEGWRAMVCVETANALEDIVHVAPSAEHCMQLEVEVSASM
jgi:D-hexose-6-phosphate mutarotase